MEMELLDNTMMLFRESIKPEGFLMREIDTYFTSQIEDKPYHKDLSENTISKINDHFIKNVRVQVQDYLFEFKHPKRKDLLAYSFAHQIDLDMVNSSNGNIYRSMLKEQYPMTINWAGVTMSHRANSLYNGNFAKWVGNLSTLAIFIGVSRPHEHDSSVDFPIQGVSVKLNRGDILVAPSGFTHPYTLASVNGGVFKLVECM